eukprot:scaffold68668_cov110-Attheya_sp.AAC.1
MDTPTSALSPMPTVSEGGVPISSPVSEGGSHLGSHLDPLSLPPATPRVQFDTISTGHSEGGHDSRSAMLPSGNPRPSIVPSPGRSNPRP